MDENTKFSYVAYRTKSLTDRSSEQILEKVEFKGWQNNRFDTVNDCIEALREDGIFYEDILIVANVFIRIPD
jgi:hypothetical protein